jgi:hypothetical protein
MQQHSIQEITLFASGAKTVAASPITGSAVDLSILTKPYNNTTIDMGPLRHAQIALTITNANGGNAELVVDGLAPGTDGSSSSHWGLLGTTTAKSSNGTYFVRIEGPLPRKIRYRLLVGGASVTCQGALIVGG